MDAGVSSVPAGSGGPAGGPFGRLSHKKLLYTEARGVGPVGEEGNIFASSRDVMGIYGGGGGFAMWSRG